MAALLGLATAAGASIGAVGQYGPPPPAPPALPGFSTVLTSESIGPAGGTVGPVSTEGATFTLTVPPGAFPEWVQVTLTAGDLAVLGPAAFTGYTINAALGIEAQLLPSGAVYPGTFLKPLTLTVHDPAFTAASVVAVWNGTSLTPYTNATSAPGVITVSFDSDPDFAFLTPTSQAAHPVPKATKPVTGKPVVGQGIVAAVLVAIGIGGLTVRRRRAAHRRGKTPKPSR